MFVIGDEFKAELRSFAKAYFELQAALAADDAEQASQAVKGLQNSFRNLDPGQLNDSAGEFWSREGGQLGQVVNQLGLAEGVDNFRSRFVLLSEQLLVVFRQFGVLGMDVYELHCPMAFGGRGAIWLQANDQPRNPYFGIQMLSCADRVRKVEPDAGSGTDHEGHPDE